MPKCTSMEQVSASPQNDAVGLNTEQRKPLLFGEEEDVEVPRRGNSTGSGSLPTVRASTIAVVALAGFGTVSAGELAGH